MRDEALQQLRALSEVVERLRAPGGCPWDGEQTHESLRPYLLEETYEVLEAIESPGHASLQEELGDVLLQVLLHSAIAAERDDGFDVGDVAETTRAKLVHRHPHVFADATVSGAAEVTVNWERLKSQEKVERLSILDGVPRTLPALSYALGVQKRPARVGFDETPDVDAAVDAVSAALADVGRARDGTDGLEAAAGALLFAVVALARRLRVNPEDALRRCATAYGDRFRVVESGVRAEGRSLHDLAPDELHARWDATP